MKRNTLFCFLAIAALGLLTAGPANASDSTWDGSESSDWDDADNWTAGVPGSGDTATIPFFRIVSGSPDPVISTADATVGRVVLASSHTITVTGRTLTLDGADVTHDIDGDLILSNSTAIVKFTVDATVDGNGSIVGQDNGAKIQIDEPSSGTNKVTSNITFKGRMSIERGVDAAGSAEFMNNGTVLANDAGTLSLGANVTLTGSGNFAAKTSGSAVLEFNKEALGLTGDFELCGDATIRFNAAIDTTGCLDEGIANGWIRGTGNNFFCHDDDNCGGAGANAHCFSSDQEFTGSCS